MDTTIPKPEVTLSMLLRPVAGWCAALLVLWCPITVTMEEGQMIRCDEADVPRGILAHVL